jgi:hypothetical protein
VSLREREAWRKYFKDLNELIDILARYPQFIELIPPPERKKYELPSLLDEFPEMEKWLSFEAREIWKRQKEIQSGIVSLAEAPPLSVEKVKALIYRVIYFSPPQPDRILIQKDKEAIGILYFRPHLFDFDIPIKETDMLGKIIRICPTAEWWEGEHILPVLKRWAPSHEMDFWEWCAWADFLLKRLEQETSDPILTIPAKGHWEIRKEKIEEKETPPPPESEWTGWYDGLNELSLEERERYEKEARAEEEKRVKEMRHKPPKIFRKKVYTEGWDDILLECMDLGLAKVETEDDIRKILEEAKERWQKYSL